MSYNLRNSFLFRLAKGLKAIYISYVKNLDITRFGFVGDHVTLGPPLVLSKPSNIYLYGDNGIKNAIIYTNNACFVMKPHSGAAEGLRVSTGNHAMILGRFYRSIKDEEKPNGYDKDVVVESDVWIGRNVTLLGGVNIGRGCTIGAGSVVTKSTPPYSVVVGVPAKPIKFKWSIDEILQHEKTLYPEDQRFSRIELESIFSKSRETWQLK